MTHCGPNTCTNSIKIIRRKKHTSHPQLRTKHKCTTSTHTHTNARTPKRARIQPHSTTTPPTNTTHHTGEVLRHPLVPHLPEELHQRGPVQPPPAHQLRQQCVPVRQHLPHREGPRPASGGGQCCLGAGKDDGSELPPPVKPQITPSGNAFAWLAGGGVLLFGGVSCLRVVFLCGGEEGLLPQHHPDDVMQCFQITPMQIVEVWVGWGCVWVVLYCVVLRCTALCCFVLCSGCRVMPYCGPEPHTRLGAHTRWGCRGSAATPHTSVAPASCFQSPSPPRAADVPSAVAPEHRGGRGGMEHNVSKYAISKIKMQKCKKKSKIKTRKGLKK